MSPNMTTTDWWKQEQRRREAYYEQRSAEFFAERTDIPDLEFETPCCSICSKPTEFDDGWFSCDVCDVSWPTNGYGHEARRWSDDATIRTATASTPTQQSGDSAAVDQ